MGVVAVCAGLIGLAVSLFVWSAPPRKITITTGPVGSSFHTNATKYARILASHGIKLVVLPSHGSLENMERLADPKAKVDVGFVLGGVTNSAPEMLVSLGSVSYQPLLVFYRGTPIEMLSGLNGKRLAIGRPGSGTRALALTLLQTNGIQPGVSATLVDSNAQESALALLKGTVDAVFLMGEDAPVALIRELLRAPDIHLLSFRQSAAYTRRFPYLNALDLPEGSLDLGKDLPTNTVHLIGPTVELVAREKLHPALSDLLLEAAQKVHGNASLLQHKGEFPAPLEHDFQISPAAARFYKSGKTLFYRYMPFWLAALISQIVVVLVPMVLLLIPLIRSAPRIYTWRVRSRIYRWYRALLALERERQRDSQAIRRDELVRRLDEIERGVNKLKVPAFAADLYYDLRGHIGLVRRFIDVDSTGNGK